MTFATINSRNFVEDKLSSTSLEKCLGVICGCCDCCKPKEKVFKTKILDIDSAPNPDSILWENNDSKFLFFRRIISIAITLLILAGCKTHNNTLLNISVKINGFSFILLNNKNSIRSNRLDPKQKARHLKKLSFCWLLLTHFQWYYWSSWYGKCCYWKQTSIIRCKNWIYRMLLQEIYRWHYLKFFSKTILVYLQWLVWELHTCKIFTLRCSYLHYCHQHDHAIYLYCTQLIWEIQTFRSWAEI